VPGSWHEHSPPGVIPILTLGTIRDGDFMLRLPLAGTVDFEGEFIFTVSFSQGSPAPIEVVLS